MNEQVLILSERVRNTIQLGESHFREFKSAIEGPPGAKKPRRPRDICADIAEALVSFANADGGDMLVGVEDDGTVSGVPHGSEEIRQMLESPRTHVHAQSQLPVTAANKLELDGKVVLFFSVTKGTTRIYQLADGRCVRRKDKRTEPGAIDQIQFERLESNSREFDQMFADGASVNDLDIQLVQSISENFLRGISVEHYLQQVGLAEFSSAGLRLRKAALLLFAKDIRRWHTRCQVRILKVAGNELLSGEHYNVTSDEQAEGNIFTLLKESWEKLRPFLAYRTEFGKDARFEQRFIYPEGACREALTNAIAHRAYNINNSIDVFIFDDRMEIKSPGPLLSTISVAGLNELKGAHESRNTLIARVLRENRFMRELGEGMRRIFELMHESEFGRPVLYSNDTWFSITLPHKSVFTPLQEQWLKLFASLNPTSQQKRVLVLGMDGRELSKRDIKRALNTTDADVYQTVTSPLSHAGILKKFRNSNQIHSYARSNRVHADDTPRFKVVLPNEAIPVHLTPPGTPPRQRPQQTGEGRPPSNYIVS